MSNAIASMLENKLKGFVDVNRNNIEVQLTTGYVRLTNLKIKTDALSSFKIPLQVIDGVVNSISVRIPIGDVLNAIWQVRTWGVDIEDILYTIGPIQVQVEGITFSIMPYESLDFQINAYEEIEKMIQNKFLAADNAFRNRLNDRATRWNLPYGTNITDNNSSVISIVSMIFTRLVQIQVKHIHIKYSDSISDPESPFQLGILLEDFHYGPCTNPCCAKATTTTINKDGTNIPNTTNTNNTQISQTPTVPNTSMDTPITTNSINGLPSTT